MGEGVGEQGFANDIDLCTNIVLRSNRKARNESESRVRCLSATSGRRPGLSGGSRRTTTSPKAIKRGDLMTGTSTTSFRAKPAAFWGKRSLHHLGLSAEQTNREGGPS